MKNKANFIAIVFVAVVIIALAIANEWLTLETFKETALAVISVILSIFGLYQTISKTEVEKDKNKLASENKELKHRVELFELKEKNG